MFGGPAIVPRERRSIIWPIITPDDEQAVMRVLRSGKFTSNTEGELEVKQLEEEWAEFVGSKYAVSVSNGTVAISLALMAIGIKPGDEIIVPALSFVASALAPLHQLAIPVFVDIDPYTFNIDPSQIEAKITSRTRAILPVHFHGLAADMDAIHAIARKHNLFIIEDAAQSHGASYHGHMTGTLGDVACFSLNVQKNLPTCGEGGLITTNDTDLYEKMLMLRQFGESVKDEEQRTYVSYIMGWNHKINAMQAAFTRSQLQRFRVYQAMREKNIANFLSVLFTLPGLRVPTVPVGDVHAWHILRFCFDPAMAGYDDVSPGSFRQALRKALRAEGVPISQYQLIPIPGMKTFQTQEGFGNGYPWALSGALPQHYAVEDYPNALATIDNSLTIQRRHLNPDAGPLLMLYAEAFCKIWENLSTLVYIARSMPYEAPWQTIMAKY